MPLISSLAKKKKKDIVKMWSFVHWLTLKVILLIIALWTNKLNLPLPPPKKTSLNV